MYLSLPLTFLNHFKLYQICVLGQPSGLSYHLKPSYTSMALKLVVKPSQKESKTHIFRVTLKAIGIPS